MRKNNIPFISFLCVVFVAVSTALQLQPVRRADYETQTTVSKKVETIFQGVSTVAGCTGNAKVCAVFQVLAELSKMLGKELNERKILTRIRELNTVVKSKQSRTGKMDAFEKSLFEAEQRELSELHGLLKVFEDQQKTYEKAKAEAKKQLETKRKLAELKQREKRKASEQKKKAAREYEREAMRNAVPLQQMKPRRQRPF
eukprot:gene1134-670_t